MILRYKVVQTYIELKKWFSVLQKSKALLPALPAMKVLLPLLPAIRQVLSVLPAVRLLLLVLPALIVVLPPSLPAVRKLPQALLVTLSFIIVCQACHCPEVSCTDNTAVVTGGVGGVMGLIILIQSVVIVVLLLQQIAKSKANKRSENTKQLQW